MSLELHELWIIPALFNSLHFQAKCWLYGVTFLLTYNLTFDSKPSFNFSIFEISNFCLKIAKQCYLFTKLIIVLFELLPSLWQSSTSLLVNFNFCEFLYHQFNFSTELSITLFQKINDYAFNAHNTFIH